MIPFLPNIPTSARAPTKGGIIKGRIVRSVNILFPRKTYRVIIYATGTPIKEVVASVREAVIILLIKPR